MTVLATAGDRLLLGGLVNAEDLAIYAIAALIARSVENALGKLFLTVLLPAFSEINRSNPSRLREAYYKLKLPADLVLLFLAGLMFSTGQLVIDLLYDPRYSKAGHFLEVLSLSLFATRYSLAHQIYLSVGITKYLAAINVVRSLSLYVLVPGLFHFFGLMGAIWVLPFTHSPPCRLFICLTRNSGWLTFAANWPYCRRCWLAISADSV